MRARWYGVVVLAAALGGVALTACATAPPAVFVLYPVDVDEPTTPDGYVSVGLALGALREDADLHAVVIGHADAQGGSAQNRELSFRRARRVRQVLLDNGIDPTRIRVAARGESQPVASNETPEGRARNRRTEVFFYLPGRGEIEVQYGARLQFSAE